MRKKLLTYVVCLATALSASLYAGCDSCKGGGSSSQQSSSSQNVGSVTLTVENVPTSALEGETVTLPAATATDSTGDISNLIKLTVQQLKDNGEVYREPIYEKAGNEETAFTPSGRYSNYKIIYSVTNLDGETTRKEFDFVMSADTEAPVMVLQDTNFDINTGIVGKTATDDIILPVVKGIDKPLDNDVTARISVKITDNVSGAIVKTISDVTNNEEFRILAGDYTVTYSLTDVAGNKAEEISFPLEVAEFDYNTNLLADQKNVVLGFDSRFNSFGELEIGKTANGVTSTGMSVATFRASRIFDEIIALNMKFDKPSADAGEAFYDIAFRGSKNADAMYPTGQEGEWPPYLVIRISENRFQLLGTSTSQVNMQYETAYSHNLFDGQYHNIFMQMSSVGESAESADAKIYIKIWVDVLPTEAPTIAAYVTSSDTNVESVVEGKLGKDDFAKLWNENTSAGWLTFAGASWGVGANGMFGDDKLTIKSLTLYPADTTEFNVDLEAPVVVVGDMGSIYTVNEAINLPSATAMDGDIDVSSKVQIKVVNANGEETLLNDSTWTPNETGNYTIVWFVADANNNIGYVEKDIRVAVSDKEAPVITVDETAINVSIGEEFTLPTAMVNDNIDGDLLASLIINLEGPYSASYIGAPGDAHVIYAAGTHKLVYTVSDFFGNVAQKEITVNVTGKTEGNLLVKDTFVGAVNETVTLNGNVEQGAYFKGQYVYEEKVSMVMKVTYQNQHIILINMRGDYKDDIWCKGLVMKIANNGIAIGTYGHDVQNIANAPNPFNEAYNCGVFVLLEYQTTNIIVEGEEYVLIKAWFNGKEIKFNPANEGVAGVDGGVMVKVSDLNEKSNAAHAGEFYVTCLHANAELTLKEVRMDGQPVESEYEIPEPPSSSYEEAKGELEILAKPESEYAFAQESNNQILNRLGTDKITFKVKFSDITMNGLTAIIQLMGKNGYWGDGLSLKATQGNLLLTAGSWASGAVLAESNIGNIMASMFTQNDVYTYIDVQMSYIKTGDVTTGLKLEVWVGTDRAEMQKVVWLAHAGYDTYVTDGELTLSLEQMKANDFVSHWYDANSGVYCYYYGYDAAGNGAGSLVLGAVDLAENMEDDVNGVANIYLVNSVTTKVYEEAGEGRRSIKLQVNNYATSDTFLIQFAGKEFEHYGNGLVVYIFTDGTMYFALGSMANHANMTAYATLNGAVLNPDCWVVGNNVWHTLDYRLTYSYADDNVTVTGVKLELWYDGEKIGWRNYGSANTVDAAGDISISLNQEMKDWGGNVLSVDKDLICGKGVYMEYIAGAQGENYNVVVSKKATVVESEPELIVCGNSTTKKLADSVGEEFSFDLKYHNSATTEDFYLQIAGNEFTHYGSGMVLYSNGGGVWFAIGNPSQHANMVAIAKNADGSYFAPDFLDPADTDWHNFKVKITYTYAQDNTTITGVKVEFWYDGAKLVFMPYANAANVVDAAGDINISYDAEVKDWGGNAITDKTLMETQGVYFEYIASINEPKYYAVIRKN